MRRRWRRLASSKKTAEGKLSFPYDAVHVDFMLKAA
jgi:hypothetical protein